MKLTSTELRIQMVMFLHALWDIAGRTDDEAAEIFDNGSAILEVFACPADERDSDFGSFLYNRAERDALRAFGARYRELSDLTGNGDEWACLSHPFYPELASAAHHAFEVLAAAEPFDAPGFVAEEADSAEGVSRRGRLRARLMAAFVTIWDLRSSSFQDEPADYGKAISEVRSVRSEMALPGGSPAAPIRFCENDEAAISKVEAGIELFAGVLERDGRPAFKQSVEHDALAGDAHAAFVTMALAGSDPPDWAR